MSKITDYTDRTTCILFGDGAGAALVERSESPSFLAYETGNDAAGGIHLYRTGLADQLDGVALAGDGKVVQNGREVYRYAVQGVPQGMQRIAEKAGLSLTDVDWFVPHSANLRMIESICEKSGFPLEKTLYSMVDYGNTSVATIPLALILGLDAEKIRKGDLILLYGFGGGLVHAGLLLRWMV